MATSSAMVETLTAEVRVLMVGNRQVTLSVYRQLDTVHLDDVEPFGRVNDGKDVGTFIVGRRKGTGELVRAQARHIIEPPFLGVEDLDGGTVTLCSTWKWKSGARMVTYKGRSIEIDEDGVTWCGIDNHTYRREQCEGWQTNGLDAQIEARIAEYDSWIAVNRTALQLPLIVLAGLR